jgi:hypothetical protein
MSGPFHVRALSSAPVTPLLLVGLGLVVLAVGAAVLLSFGPRYRVGRLLATAPVVSVAEAVRLAGGPAPRYVRIEGRIDSEQEFEDADHRPLVLRRMRIETRSGLGGRWRTVEDGIETVPFQLNEGLDTIAIDESGLRDGLVVVPRQSVGVAGDLGDRLPADVPRDTPTRVTIEQVSSVEHAIVLGLPVTDGAGQPRIAAGLGRPLVLTTLEVAEAMRILTGGAILRARIAAGCLVAGATLVVVGGVWWAIGSVASPAAAFAASAIPSILPGADTRSAGQGPGLVGNPALALLGVLGIGLAALLATLLYVRLTSRHHRS